MIAVKSHFSIKKFFMKGETIMNRKHFFLSFSRMMTVILVAGIIGLFAPAITTAGLNEWTTNGPGEILHFLLQLILPLQLQSMPAPMAGSSRALTAAAAGQL